MSLREYLLNIEGNNLENNVYTSESHQKAEEFKNKYSFLNNDAIYLSFIEEINGVEIYATETIIIFYGFAISEPELVYPVEKYLDVRGYLLIGEFTEKRKHGNWRTIGYYYQQSDENPVIYAKFFSDLEEVKDRYYPLCNGFQELLGIVFQMNFDEQFKIAYTPDYLLE